MSKLNSNFVSQSDSCFKMQTHDLIEYAKAQIVNCQGVEAANAILKFLNENNTTEIVYIACSGDNDSVFLVNSILDRFPNLKSRFVILHFNHNLHGDESNGDEQFVKTLANDCRPAFYSKKMKNKPANVSEDRLRDLRNEFFEHALGKVNSRVLVIGHQKMTSPKFDSCAWFVPVTRPIFPPHAQ
jgi:hypothetical protein